MINNDEKHKPCLHLKHEKIFKKRELFHQMEPAPHGWLTTDLNLMLQSQANDISVCFFDKD